MCIVINVFRLFLFRLSVEGTIDRRGNGRTTGPFAISGDGSFSSVVAPCDRVNVALLAAPGAMLAVCPKEIPQDVISQLNHDMRHAMWHKN